MAEKIEVIENKRIADTTYQITALCSVCNDGRTNVVQFEGHELFICKKCLESAIRVLEEHMQDQFQLEFDKARHSHDQGMRPKPNIPIPPPINDVLNGGKLKMTLKGMTQ